MKNIDDNNVLSVFPNTPIFNQESTNRIGNNFVKLNEKELMKATQISKNESIFRIIYKMIGDEVIKEKYDVSIENIDLQKEAVNMMNDLLNNKWKEATLEILRSFLVYGFCAIYITIDNGEMLLNLPSIHDFNIYFDRDGKTRFFWKHSSYQSLNLGKEKEGFFYPYGINNENYRDDRKNPSLPSSISYAKFIKNFIEKNPIKYRKKNKDGNYVGKKIGEDQKNNYGIEDPNVLVFYPKYGNPDPQTGNLNSDTQGAFGNFDLLNSIRKLIISSEVQKMNPIVFIEKNEEKKTRTTGELETMSVQLRNMEVINELEEKKEEDKKKQSELIEEKLNEISSTLQTDKRYYSNSPYSDLINAISKKTLIGLPEGTHPVFLNTHVASQEALITFNESIKSEIAIQFGIPPHKLNRTKNVRTDNEEKVFESTVNQWVQNDINIKRKLLGEVGVVLIIYCICMSKKVIYADDYDEMNEEDDREEKKESSEQEFEELFNKKESDSLQLLGTSNAQEFIEENPIFTYISSIIGEEMKKEEKNIELEKNRKKNFKKADLQRTLQDLESKLRIRIESRKIEQETVPVLEEWFDSGIIDKKTYLVSLERCYEKNAILSNALLKQRVHDKQTKSKSKSKNKSNKRIKRKQSKKDDNDDEDNNDEEKIKYNKRNNLRNKKESMTKRVDDNKVERKDSSIKREMSDNKKLDISSQKKRKTKK